MQIESPKEASNPESIQKKACILMMSVGTVGLEIILDILGKSILLRHQLGGGESGREIKDMGALRVVFTMQQGVT